MRYETAMFSNPKSRVSNLNLEVLQKITKLKIIKLTQYVYLIADDGFLILDGT